MKYLSSMAPVALVLVSACAIRSEDPELTEVPITVKFPSVEASAYVDNIEIQVFDLSQTCEARMQQRRQGSEGQPLVTTGPTSVCRFANGTVSLEAPLGEHVFVAIGTSGGRETLSGCVQQVLGTDAALLPIALSRSGDGPVGTDNCSLANFCAGTCPGP